MGDGIRDYGAVITLAAGTAAGSYTFNPTAHGHLRARIKLEVDASAGWTGTFTVTPTRTGTIAETATTKVVGDLTASGTAGYLDVTIDNATSITLAVATNNKACRVYVRTYSLGDTGAVV